MSQAPLKWAEILTIKTELLKKATKIAKNNCSLPAHRSRGATLLVKDSAGKALLGNADYHFPMCAGDWKVMINRIKEIHPKATTLHMMVGVDSSRGNRAFGEANFKAWTGSAEQLVYTYPAGAVLTGSFRDAA